MDSYVEKSAYSRKIILFDSQGNIVMVILHSFPPVFYILIPTHLLTSSFVHMSLTHKQGL